MSHSVLPLSRGLLLASLLAAGSAHATLLTYSDLASFGGAATTSVVEDFEAVAPKNVALGSLSHNGITYTPYGGVPSPNIWVAGPGYNNFSTPTTTSSVLTANGDEDFLMSFAATSAIGFDTYLNAYGPATITVLGVSGTLGVYTMNQNPAQIGFWGVTSDAGDITGIRWDTVLGGQINTGIDNIRMGSLNSNDPEAVPEPSALALMGLGLMLVCLAARKRLALRR